MSPLQLALEALKRREILVDGKATGTVALKDAEDLLQILEVQILNEQNGPVYSRRKRIHRPVPENKATIIRVVYEKLKGNAKADGGGSSSR